MHIIFYGKYLKLISIFILIGCCGYAQKPNIIIIYADDLGYGDVSCYKAGKIFTPNIDRIAKNGITFARAHSSSATCTPSRYSLISGRYAWRRDGTGIAAGDAALILDTSQMSMASMLKKSGYATGVVGKWHLGLGDSNGVSWNGVIRPGPKEVGFDYSFIMAATLDRVPCVYIENSRVVNLDPTDPISVSYGTPIGKDPTAVTHPGLLAMKPTHGHNNTIINGISRIGFMSGGNSARWKDEEVAGAFTEKAVSFIKDNSTHPFFLYFASGDPHVPRAPNKQFIGNSGMGPRGDAILQLDWSVGRIWNTLDSLGLLKNTLVVFTSDNGPVLNDGYQDDAVEKLNGHTPWGPFRGGKYSILEAGTRVPFLVSWPGKIKQGRSDALISQVDLLASFAALTGQKINEPIDSRNMLAALLNKNAPGRKELVEHAWTLALVTENWKYIAPSSYPEMNTRVNIHLGNAAYPQLYNIKSDMAERNNLATKYPQIVNKMAHRLEQIKSHPQ